jgi:hypothetical protein
MAEKQLFKSANEFSQHIQNLALDEGITCMQALLQYCDENDLEPDEIAKSVSRNLKDQLEVEFAEMGLLSISPTLYD